MTFSQYLYSTISSNGLRILSKNDTLLLYTLMSGFIGLNIFTAYRRGNHYENEIKYLKENPSAKSNALFNYLGKYFPIEEDKDRNKEIDFSKNFNNKSLIESKQISNYKIETFINRINHIEKPMIKNFKIGLGVALIGTLGYFLWYKFFKKNPEPKKLQKNNPII